MARVRSRPWACEIAGRKPSTPIATAAAANCSVHLLHARVDSPNIAQFLYASVVATVCKAGARGNCGVSHVSRQPKAAPALDPVRLRDLMRANRGGVSFAHE